uniref:Transmembrane protein n=1 Tax=Panagrolaimus davidi TaxID=227884 RepID=A0A914PHJ1_9BILA
MNVCKITNSSIFSNSVKLRETCFEYLLECNQKKIFVADLDSMDKDFALELMKSSFSQSPNLNEFEMIPQIVEQVQNQRPQIRGSFADDYGLNKKDFGETFLSSQLSPMNVCALANLSILTNSVKLRETCFEYLLECNQKKIFVSDLDSVDKDFAFELMKSSFSQSPNLNIMIPQTVEQIQNLPPQIRKLFFTKVTVLTAFMVIASFLIGTFLTNDVESFLQGINQIWFKHIFCGIQLIWFGVYFAIDHFQVLRQQKYLKWISLLIFVALSGFLVTSCIIYYGQMIAILASVFTLFFTIYYIKTSLFESYDFTDDYFWPFCLIPYVFILLIKDFLPFSWLFSIFSGTICLALIQFTLVKQFQQIMGNKSVVIPENEFCRASLTLFTIILQVFIFTLGLICGIVKVTLKMVFEL